MKPNERWSTARPHQISFRSILPTNFLYRSSLDDFLFKAYSNRCARWVL